MVNSKSFVSGLRKLGRVFLLVFSFSPFLVFTNSCDETIEHIAPPIYERDSASVMTSYGVNTLISDSGVMKYRIVTEVWDVNTVKNPTRWTFHKGIFVEQFDEKFHVEAYIQADTAYYYDTNKLWELRGRVRVRTKDGLRFSSEELFWDQNRHELYSHRFSRVVTPERELQGSYFTSDERMTHYTVSNSKGSFVRGADGMGTNSGDSILSAPDSVKSMKRMPTEPVKKSPVRP
ncbi:MAG: LPS export ABC transporter periplasmic protein LptC [Prevotella sp.]|jgi:LPS export ABC transporter protein LptC|nr:LPS export ABC transporter periplasmic protein LptC [Prevotella sp.]